LQSSVAQLRARGHFERYLARLDPDRRDILLGPHPPTWTPIDGALAHYRACERLDLSIEERVVLGEAVGDKIQGPFVAALVQSARAVGLSPYTLLGRFDALWERLFQGGSAQVTKTGPKDVTIELVGAKLPRYDYFRTGFTGIVKAGFRLVGTRAAYAQQVGWDSRSDRFVLRVSWV
jgi:hypothetical protein